jgi:prepilin-type N-terminal cleavage/methylation domain-containing protein
MSKRGFSVIELAIVLAILGIVATIAVSNLYSAIPHSTLESAQLRMAEVMMSARNLARSEELNTRVVIDPDAGTYWVESQDRTTLNWANASPGGRVETLPDIIDVQNVTFGANTVQYTTRGTMLVGGTITLIANNGETIDLVGNITTGRFTRNGGHLR